METTKNNLSDNEIIFFNNISNYLDTPIYYYGSIQRNDYFVGNSDIDIAIFSNDPKGIILKLQQLLDIDKTEIKKTLYKVNTYNKKIVPGYKIKYNNKTYKINTEFSIYNEKFKNLMLNEHKSKSVLPVHISLIIIILKFLYYRLNLLSNTNFRMIKRILLNEGQQPEFIVL